MKKSAFKKTLSVILIIIAVCVLTLIIYLESALRNSRNDTEPSVTAAAEETVLPAGTEAAAGPSASPETVEAEDTETAPADDVPADAAAPETTEQPGTPAESAETEEPAPVEAEEETVETQETVELTVDDTFTDDDILALADRPEHLVIDGTNCSHDEALSELAALRPDCEFRYCVTFEDVRYVIQDTTELAVNSKDDIETALRSFPCLVSLDLTSLTMQNDEMDVLISEYPDVDFIWMVRVIGYRIRSDIECFSTLCTTFETEGSVHYGDSDLAPLFKYCTHLVALDIGHNLISDLTPLTNLKELKYLILADERNVTDMSPLAQMTQLEYLEAFDNYNVTDFSFLYSLTNLKALNISANKGLTDFGWFDSMQDLEILWIYRTGISTDILKQAVEDNPDIMMRYCCQYGGPSVTCCGWRATDINVALRQAFAQWVKVDRVYSWDNITYTMTPTKYLGVYEH